MPINSNDWGDRVEAAVRGFGITAGNPISQGTLAQIWRAIKAEDKTEMTTKADIDLQATDVPVDPGTFKDGQGQAITGVGQSQATGPLNARIK